MDTTEQDHTTTVDTHLAAYGEPDPTRRRALLAQVWTEDGRLVDPPGVGDGHAGIDELAVAVQARFPDHRFRRTTEVDAHNDVLRYGWELVAPDGSVAAPGVDVAQVAPDGRLRHVAGFLGELVPVGR